MAGVMWLAGVSLAEMIRAFGPVAAMFVALDLVRRGLTRNDVRD
jgi:hypothetical protein